MILAFLKSTGQLSYNMFLKKNGKSQQINKNNEKKQREDLELKNTITDIRKSLDELIRKMVTHSYLNNSYCF